MLKAAKEYAHTEGFTYSWRGTRIPERIVITDPTDQEGRKTLFDAAIGYMKNGIVISTDADIVGIYHRTIDQQPQEDGTYLNEIVLYPVDHNKIWNALFGWTSEMDA